MQPNGAKYWRFKYRYLGKEKLLSVGVYPDVGVKAALERLQAAAISKVDEIDIFDPETFARSPTLAETVRVTEQVLAVSDSPAFVIIRAYDLYKQVRDDCATTDSARRMEYLRLLSLGVPRCNPATGHNLLA